MPKQLFKTSTNKDGEKEVIARSNPTPEFWRRLGRRITCGAVIIIDGKRWERIDKRRFKARFGEPQKQPKLWGGG